MTEPTATASNSMQIEEEEFIPTGCIHSIKTIVGVSSYSGTTDLCAICRRNIDSPSANYENSTPGTIIRKESCKVAFQSCGHPFHYDCLMGWYKQRPQSCPLCSKEGVSIQRIDIVPGHESEV